LSFTSKLMQAYFNYAYNPVYDFTTARLSRYHTLQKRCVGKLDLEDNDKVLCVGLGTGNEVFHILETNKNVDIVGIDYSHIALQKAYKKALGLGKEIKCLIMDARFLEFTAGSFDKVLCIHVMDFAEENEKVTHEIVRVLRNSGRFAITYPSTGEGLRLAIDLFKDSLHHNSSLFKLFLRLTAIFIGGGIVYFPLFLLGNRRGYSSSQLEAMFAGLKLEEFYIEADTVYQDFIVYGSK